MMNNGGVYRGDDVNDASADPAPTVLDPAARHERLIEAFGGTGYHVTTPAQLSVTAKEGNRTMPDTLPLAGIKVIDFSVVQAA